MKLSTLFLGLLLTSVCCFVACDYDVDSDDVEFAKTLELPDVPFPYDNALTNKPNHFIGSGNFNSPFIEEEELPLSKITNEKATLGRVLFYDKQLSLNNSVACATCHNQSKGFADPVAFSRGIEGKLTSRNSMTIVNTAFSSKFFWEATGEPIEQQVLKPVKNHIEMGIEEPADLEEKLQRIPYYAALFESAFGTTDVTEERIGDALAQFLNSMVSYDTKYDKGKLHDSFSNFNDLEMVGLNIFRQSCENCHLEPNFAAQGWRTIANIGLDKDYSDQGVGQGHFKIPTLRNIAFTAPYMHDGRFNTLEEVIDHYNEGVQDHPVLDWALKNPLNFNEPIRFNWNAAEKKALIAFLHTLTDEQMLTDQKFSNPFK